jgi:hypothetical protein
MNVSQLAVDDPEQVGIGHAIDNSAEAAKDND